MPVPVMRIREMFVRVGHGFVPVPMRVAYAWRKRFVVLMAMVGVVLMRVLVGERIVRVLVPMPFGKMEPHARGHQGSGGDELDRYRFLEQRHRDQCAGERRR